MPHANPPPCPAFDHDRPRRRTHQSRLCRRQHHPGLRRQARPVLPVPIAGIARRGLSGRQLRRQRPHAPEAGRLPLLEGKEIPGGPRDGTGDRDHHARHQRHQAAELEVRGGVRRRLPRTGEIFPVAQVPAEGVRLPSRAGSRQGQLRHQRREHPEGDPAGRRVGQGTRLRRDRHACGAREVPGDAARSRASEHRGRR